MTHPAEPARPLPEPPLPEQALPKQALAGQALPEQALPGTDAFYRVVAARRDVRTGFRPDPVSDEILTRVLTAAHQAPSVGLSQPWDFILLRDLAVRGRLHALVRRQQEAFAGSLPWPRARAFRELKVEAILDTPLCIVVTCDSTRGGRHVLGRHAQPQVANFLAGGAAVNAIAAQVGAEVCVIDVGVAADLPAAPGLLPRKVRAGTADMTAGPAMSRDEAVRAIEVGIETARDLVTAGHRCLLTGDMGIANTTASAALIAVLADADPADVTGRGTGIDDATWARKVDVVRRALARNQPDPADPVGVLAAVGGLEHAAITGFLLGAAALRTPAVLDGVIAGAAALAARAIAAEVTGCLVAGHQSAEPGARIALAALGLRPLIDLDLRLGEGSGATLALPLLQSAARVLRDVATFDSAGVSGEKDTGASP